MSGDLLDPGLHSGLWSLQKKEAPSGDEEHELELDQLEPEPQVSRSGQEDRRVMGWDGGLQELSHPHILCRV